MEGLQVFVTYNESDVLAGALGIPDQKFVTDSSIVRSPLTRYHRLAFMWEDGDAEPVTRLLVE